MCSVSIEPNILFNRIQFRLVIWRGMKVMNMHVVDPLVFELNRFDNDLLLDTVAPKPQSQIQEDRHLYVMDAYHGLFRLNLSSCTAHGNPGSCQIRHLFNAKIRLELPSPMWRPANRSEEKPKELYSLPPKFFNDFDISQSDGCIYFTDSSYMWSRSNNRYCHFEIARLLLSEQCSHSGLKSWMELHGVGY